MNNFIEKIQLSSGLIAIEDGAFEGFIALKTIIIPDGVTAIGDYAFSGCTALTAVSLPDTVTTIGNNAFSGCENLEIVIIPNSVESIGDNAFDEGVAYTSDGLPLAARSALIEDIDEYFLNSLEEFGTVPD